MFKPRITWALARGVLLETVRRKDLWVVAILGGLIIGAAGTLGFFGMNGLQVFIKDLAFNVLGVFSTALAILIASRQLPEEIKNRTLYPLLARPITRFDFLLGKLVGSICATWIAFLILCSTTAIAMSLFGVSFEAIMLQYVMLKALGLALVCALSQTLSIYMTASGAATLAFVLAFSSSRISQALVMSYSNVNGSAQTIYKFLNAILPQPGLFDIGARAANIGWAPVPIWVVGALVGYFLVYSGALMTLSWTKFQKKPL